MANEVTIPILPCRQLDDSIPFYEALGFVRTYRQVGDRSTATKSLDEALSLAVTDQERTTLAAEIDHATELVDGLDT